MGRLSVMVGVVMILGGCADLPEFMRLDRSETEKTNWIAPVASRAGAPVRPLYCYRTIGEPDCYAASLPAREIGRLEGYYGPPPAGLDY